MLDPAKDVYQAALRHNLGLFLAHPEVNEALQRHAVRCGVSSQEVAKAMIWFMQNRAQDQVRPLLLSETGSHNQTTVAQLLQLIESHIAPALLLNIPQAGQVFGNLAGEFGIAPKQFEEYVYGYVYRNQDPSLAPLDASSLSRICGEALKELLLEELLERLKATHLLEQELQRTTAAEQIDGDPAFQALLPLLDSHPETLSALLRVHPNEDPETWLAPYPELAALPAETRQSLRDFLGKIKPVLAQAEQYIERLMRVNHYQVLVSPYDLQQEPRKVQAIVNNTVQQLQLLEEGAAREPAAQALSQQMRQIVRGGLDARKYTHRVVLEKGREANEQEVSNFLQKRAQGIAPVTRLKATLLADEERPHYTASLALLEESLTSVIPAYEAALSMLLRQIFFRPLEAHCLEELTQGEEKQLANQARQERLAADLQHKQREARSMGMLARLMPGRNQEDQEELEAALQKLRQEEKALFARKIEQLFWLRALKPMQEVLAQALAHSYFATFHGFMENRQANRLGFSLQGFLTGADSMKLQAELQETLQEAFPLGSSRLLGVVGNQEQAVQGMWKFIKDPQTRKELQSYGPEAMGEKHREMVLFLVEQLSFSEESTDALQAALHASLNGFLELMARLELFFAERYEENVYLDTGSTAHCSLVNYFRAKATLLEDYTVELVGKAEDRDWTVEILNVYDSQARQVLAGKAELDPHSSVSATVMGEIKQRFAVNRYQILTQLYPPRDKSPSRWVQKTDQGLRWRP